MRLPLVQGALYYANGPINVVTDLIILGFSVWIAWDLQIRSKYKLLANTGLLGA